MYRCSYFPEKHTAVNIEKVIDENLAELNLLVSLLDTLCTTDKGSNIICATLAKTHIDCACHRINKVIDIAWKKAMDSNPELKLLDHILYIKTLEFVVCLFVCLSELIEELASRRDTKIGK